MAAGLYTRTWRTYRAWAPSLLLLAALLFAPLALLDALTASTEIDSVEPGGELKVAALLAAVLAAGLTGLLGEVFYTGTVAIALTHPRDGEPPPLREIAGMIAYRRLIAVDLIYGLIVAVGLLLLVAPGIAAFAWLALAAPVVEIEHRGVRAAFARSVALVRGRFWTVLAVLLPIQLADEAVAGLAARAAHGALGDALAAEWATEFASNLIVTPLYAVAAVLLTVTLIAEKEARAPTLHSPPARL